MKQKKDVIFITAYLDEQYPENIAIYLVMEHFDEKYGYLKGGRIQARKKTGGWRLDEGRWLNLSMEYGNVGEHSLLTNIEAHVYLDQMGLKLQDGVDILIENYKTLNGQEPEISSIDADIIKRREAALKRL